MALYIARPEECVLSRGFAALKFGWLVRSESGRVGGGADVSSTRCSAEPLKGCAWSHEREVLTSG